MLIVGFVTTVITACSDDPEVTPTAKDCIDCKEKNIIKRTIVLGSKDSSITIYPIITPNNHEFCDSFVYNPIMGAYVQPYQIYNFQKLCSSQEAIDSIKAGNDTACPCIINPDEIYNDYKNAYFHIDGIDKFPYNRLIIYWTDAISTYGGYDESYYHLIGRRLIYNNYDNKNNLFIGEVPKDSTTVDSWNMFPNTKPLPTGIYNYSISLYKDEKHITQIGETIQGTFAIIRTQKILVEGCKEQALNIDDPLLN